MDTRILEVEYWEKFSIRSYDKIREYIEFIKRIYEIGDRDLDYYEHHHIVPVSFKSDNSDLIHLTPYEHFTAHKILSKCFSEKYGMKMVYAYKRIVDNPRVRNCISEEEFNSIRRDFSKALSEKYSGERNFFYGRHHSDEARKRISSGRKTYFENMSEDEHKRYCDSKKKDNLSPKARENMSKGQIGNKNRLGIPTSDETKRKISESLKGKLSGSSNPNYGNKLSNKFWVTNEIDNIRVGEEDIEKYISIGYRRGRVSRRMNNEN